MDQREVSGNNYDTSFCCAYQKGEPALQDRVWFIPTERRRASTVAGHDHPA